MAKLVDILARELKEWPEGVFTLSQLQHNGAIINGKGYDGREWGRLQIAEDTPPAGVLVTKAQWRSVVGALKTESAPAWFGVGLPPVGTVCELRARGGGWGKAEIKYHGRAVCVWLWSRDDGNIEQVEHALCPDYMEFRPVRTPEQIAAEERDREIADLYFTINWNEGRETWPIISNGRKADYAKAIDAGYRKFEIVDEA